MRTLILKNRFQGNSTIIENDFIDHYMAKANGEYVKVYLLLLRHIHAQDSSLTISTLADDLDCTEKDIVRALNYWSGVGLLKIDYDESGTICGLALGKSSPSVETQNAESVLKDTVPLSEVDMQPGEAPSEISNEDLKQLYFVAEQYMGKPLSVTEIRKIQYFFDTLHFSTDLIEYLIEYCVENGHKSMHYIESVAIAWSDQGITSVTEAKATSSVYNKNCFAVMKAFGIHGRGPAPFEVNYIRKWTEEYCFTLELIVEACNRTIANTAKPDFKYADSILSSWFEKGVHHLEDVKKQDAVHQKSRVPKQKVFVKNVPASQNRFNNFEGRTYDMNSLEQQLLAKR